MKFGELGSYYGAVLYNYGYELLKLLIRTLTCDKGKEKLILMQFEIV